MSKNALLLYPNQLFSLELLPGDVDRIVLVEDPSYFGLDPSRKLYLNKQKLVFIRATMRRYLEEVLWPAGFDVDYIEMHKIKSSIDIVNHVDDYDTIRFFDTCDSDLNRVIMSELKNLNPSPEVEMIQTPNFYINVEEINSFFARHNKYTFEEFYLWQRERFNVLIDPETYKPLGGSLTIHPKPLKKALADFELPSFQVFGSNKYVEESIEFVNKSFPDNPGNIDDFNWPTSSVESEKWLDEFIKHRLQYYAHFEESLGSESPWLFHSAIGPMLNSGLLQPHYVVSRVVGYGIEHGVDLANIEGFVRNILGWREYTRALYIKKGVTLRTSNSYGHNRGLTADWYSGNTGILPVDAIINKLNKHGYAHQSEIIMVIGNFMFLSDIHPEEIHFWMLEMIVDSSDWSIIPYVFGLIQGERGTSVSGAPAISSSNYILKMSDYKRGNWSDVWDGLYWRFIDKNKEALSKIKPMSLTLSHLKRLTDEQKRILGYRAEDFLNAKTSY